MKWKSLSRVWLCGLMDHIVHGILQTSILEWVAVPFSRGSSQPRDWTQVTCIAGGFFTVWATRAARMSGRTKTKTWIFSFLGSLFFCIILSYFNSTHFKALNTFPSSPVFTHQIDSFTLLLAAATKYWYHLYTIQRLLLLLLSRFSCVWLLRPHRRQPIRLLCPQDSLGKNTGVGCHFLLQQGTAIRLQNMRVTCR